MKQTTPYHILFALAIAALLYACSGNTNTATENKDADTTTKKTNNSWENYALKGKVKLLTMDVYDVKFGEKNKQVNKQVLTFNNKGFVVAEEFTNNEGVKHKSGYKYDADNNTLEYIVYKPNDSINFINKYENTKKGNELTIVITTGQNKSNIKNVVRYDDNNNILERAAYLKDTIYTKTTYKYNAENNVTESVVYGSDGNPNYKYQYTYAGGKLSGEKYLNGTNDLIYETTYKYNEKGLKIESLKNIIRAPAKGFRGIAKTVYEGHDAAGNPTKEMRYEGEKLNYIIDYKYEYFE